MEKFEHIRLYLLGANYTAGCSKSEKYVIRRRAKDYLLDKGLLNYIGHMKGCNEDPTKKVKVTVTMHYSHD